MPDAPRSRALHRFAVATAVATLALIVAGGLVTSTESGLSVPDWPLSYGRLMPPMVGGVFYEHGHRMVATAGGLLSIGLAVWLSRRERRAWVRRLGWAALGAVVARHEVLRTRFAGYRPGPVALLALGLLTYALINVTWVFFRATSMTAATRQPTCRASASWPDPGEEPCA